MDEKSVRRNEWERGMEEFSVRGAEIAPETLRVAECANSRLLRHTDAAVNQYKMIPNKKRNIYNI